MKKILLIALIASTLAGCKKNSDAPMPYTPPPVAVTYTFTSTQNDTYTIKYTDSNATVSTVTVNGNNWSKSMNMAQSKARVLTLYVESANKSFNASGSLSIAVTGQSDPPSMPLLSNSYTYGMRGQITYLPDFN